MIHMNDLVMFINQMIERFSLADRSTSRHRAVMVAKAHAEHEYQLTHMLIVALRLLIVLTVLTGFVYPLGVTVIVQAVLPVQANGSLVVVEGRPVGSLLIGQAVTDARYFWPRPSAVEYMAGSMLESLGSSGATNFGMTSAALAAAVAERAQLFRAANGLRNDTIVPPDMLLASGSGLDPDISPEAARLQVGRIARARNVDPAQIAALVEQHVEGPQLGFLGAPRVNVLRLNLALDGIQ